MSSADIGGDNVRQTARTGEALQVRRRQSPIRSAAATLLTDEQAAREVVGVSVRTFASLIGEPWMPVPIQLGQRLRRWVRSELEAAILNAPRQTTANPMPAQLLRGKIERMKKTGTSS